MKRSTQCKWMGLLLLAALLLCGCGGQAEVIDNVVPTSQVIEIRPDPSALCCGTVALGEEYRNPLPHRSAFVRGSRVKIVI